LEVEIKIIRGILGDDFMIKIEPYWKTDVIEKILNKDRQLQ